MRYSNDWLYPGPGAQHQREELHNDPLLRAVSAAKGSVRAQDQAMSRQRIGSAQQAVLHVLSAYGLTAETDVQHWATVASVAEMGNMTPATARGALRGLQRACLVERRPAPARRGRPSRAHVYALTPAGQREAVDRNSSD